MGAPAFASAAGLLVVVEADDNYTGAHSRDVVELARRVAKDMSLDRRRRRHVELAALLHDVAS